MCWIIYIFYIIGSIVTGDILESVSRSVNGKVARRSLDISAFFIWRVMTIRKKQVSHLLHDVENLISNKNKGIPKLWIITGIIITIVIPLASSMCLAIPFRDERDCRIFVKHHSFGFDLVNEGSNCDVLLIEFLIRQLFVYTLRTAVTVVYVIICCTLRNILNTHSELGAKRVTNPNAEIDYAYFKSYMQKQDSVLSVLKSFEKTMSLPIFLIVSSDFMAIIYGVVKLDPLNNIPEHKLSMKRFIPGIIFISLRGVASFLSISFAASEVHEASKNATDVEKAMLKQILISREKANIQKAVSFKILHSSPPFILSAWGIFRFTKSLFLSVFGNVLTYSLLIMQILK
ncbi:uncharacterized protein NPIL_502561 [Nephila pilipes]|uniref:Gustatory receptor n=1 Tax=Nephila pilipes TaxID=299642 RepID=A0A8X6I3A3_NEPPI|nr:uncharacterized protein NPIL_502561 [Nephila pilipes]